MSIDCDVTQYKIVTYSVLQGEQPYFVKIVVANNINFEKTWYLPFTPCSKSLPIFSSLNIGQYYSIPETKSMKYLGIIVDRHLEFNRHIKNVIEISEVYWPD